MIRRVPFVTGCTSIQKCPSFFSDKIDSGVRIMQIMNQSNQKNNLHMFNTSQGVKSYKMSKFV